MIGAPPTVQENRSRKQIHVRVFGVPKGQPRPRAFARRFGTTFSARVYDPGTAEGWKSCVAAALRQHIPAEPVEGPIRVDITYLMPRPKRLCRAKDPDGRILSTDKPDLDNLNKAVMDAMTAIGIWRDDSQVCVGESWKLYAAKNERPGAEIKVFVL